MAKPGFNWGDIFRLPQTRRRTYTYRPRMTIQRRILGAIAVVILAALGWIYNRITGNTPATKPDKPSQSEVNRDRESRPRASETRRDSSQSNRRSSSTSKSEADAKLDLGAQQIADAFEAGTSDHWVETQGRVLRLLPDDNDGSRHQNFIVEIAGGMTLKVSHNIDLADRIPVAADDRVRFRGEYEWSEQGGVIHWTHHDPDGRIRGGWIEHKNKKYE